MFVHSDAALCGITVLGDSVVHTLSVLATTQGSVCALMVPGA